MAFFAFFNVTDTLEGFCASLARFSYRFPNYAVAPHAYCAERISGVVFTDWKVSASATAEDEQQQKNYCSSHCFTSLLLVPKNISASIFLRRTSPGSLFFLPSALP